MGSCKINLDSAKGKYMSKQAPENMELIVRRAISIGKKKKGLKFIKPLIAAASIVLILIVSINLSPAFANCLDNIGFGEIVELVSFNKGYKDAAENGVLQVINKSCEDKGIKLTIDSLILDKRSLAIAYTLETKDEHKDLMLYTLNITDKSGNKLKTYLIIGGHEDLNFSKNKKKKDVITLQNYDENTIFPEEITLECTEILSGIQQDSKVIDGSWKIDFKLSKELLKITPKNNELNMAAQVDSMKFVVEYLKTYPTVADLKIKFDDNNPYRFTSFKNLHLVDEKGNKYLSRRTTTLSDNEIILHFESNYFSTAKELYLAADGMYLMPKEDRYLVFDAKNKKVIEDGGYGIEFLEDIKDMSSTGRGYQVWFNVKDSEINKEKSGWGVMLAMTAFDEKNKNYNISLISREPNDKQQIGFEIEKLKNIPNTFKIKIEEVSKGIIKPIRMRIK